MNFAWSYLFVLIWLAYMIASGVLLFSRGFLLSRVSKTDVSSCRHLSINPDDNYYLTEGLVQEIFKDVNASSNLCLPQKSKVIILLVDALKYEFGVYQEQKSNPLPYENKLTIFRELMQNSPDQSRLMQFKADPPTTTLQRLKGLTTGSLPTFIDIGSNFASPEINEDNIIDQISRANMSLVFMGDSTWTDLYPKRFKRSYSYPSFDIYDLDSVDTKIREHLPKEMDKGDWQVLIAHFLGVDHCGHRYGPLHQEMARKLTEMDKVIRNVVERMDENTTLLVMGDHGMTLTGDHGGDTPDETNALLFAYTKQNKFISKDFGSDTESLQQIDIVPTLAAILGVPIPYSNLGLINFNIVPDVDVPYMSKFQVLLLHAWQNAQQIYNYFYNYALENKRTFNVDKMDNLETEFILLTHRAMSIYNELAFKSFFKDLNSHLRDILATCRSIWVKFDATQMSHGLLVTFMPIFFGFLLLCNSRAVNLYRIFTPKGVAYTYLLNIAAGVFGYRYYKNFAFKTEEHAVIFFTNILSMLVLAYHTAQNWSALTEHYYQQHRRANQNLPARVVMVFAVCVFFSNSFIIQEQKILSYLLGGVLIVMVVDLIRQTVRFDLKARHKLKQLWRSHVFKFLVATVLAIGCLRAAHYFFRCREEQGNCSDFASYKSQGNKSLNMFAFVVIVFYTILTRMYLRSCGNLTGNSVNVLMARYGPVLACFCVGAHIYMSNVPLKHVHRAHIDLLALVIYALLALQILVVSVAPLMVHVLSPKRTITVDSHSKLVPEIFRKMKQMYDGDESDRRDDIPVVYGLATIYSSIVVAFGIFLAMVLTLLLDPKASIGLLLCVAVASVLLGLHAVLRFKTASNFESCVEPTFTAVVGWFLLAHFCFFATSHQTTLSQIDWRAAFVGRSASLAHSNFVSGILVMMNTFCGQILFFCLYGLLCTETFSLFALFPHLIRHYGNRPSQRDAAESRVGGSSTRPTMSELSLESVGFDMTRGELILFENEAVFLGSAFKVAAQLFIIQGVRVFCSMLSCTLHCRHLMVWKIFAPRFIYEALATFVSLPAIICGFLLIVRIHRALDSFIQHINNKTK